MVRLILGDKKAMVAQTTAVSRKASQDAKNIEADGQQKTTSGLTLVNQQ